MNGRTTSWASEIKFAITSQLNNVMFLAITISSIAISCHQAQNVTHREDQTAFDEGSKYYLCVSCAQEVRAVKQANRGDPRV